MFLDVLFFLVVLAFTTVLAVAFPAGTSLALLALVTVLVSNLVIERTRTARARPS